jgi:hypothetical protein
MSAFEVQLKYTQLDGTIISFLKSKLQCCNSLPCSIISIEATADELSLALAQYGFEGSELCLHVLLAMHFDHWIMEGGIFSIG